MTSRKKRRNGADPNAEREAERYENPIASREHLLEILRDHGAPLTYERFAERLGLHDDEDRREALRRRLNAMVRDGQLLRNRRDGYIPLEAADLIRGRIIAHPDGFGFLHPDDGSDDLYLSSREMRSVLHGDRALARVSGIDRRGRREGMLVEVIERANEQLVGRLMQESGAWFVAPDNRRITQDVLIPSEQLGSARAGQIVVVTLTAQPSRRSAPVGRIERVLGDHMAPGMEIEVAIHAHGIPAYWPREVDAESATVPEQVPEADKPGRVDLRELPLVTIDGEDAKDFDDAVYCERRRKGWRLLVAIADVSHYVQPDSALDKEAQLRGTSVYFPGRVVPMLPEVLSNGLCSLNPEVDRLCMVCELSISDDGKITRSRFFEGLMRSHARLTYTEVASILIGGDKEAAKRRAALLPMLQELHSLYRTLKQARTRRGAIDFEGKETRIVFDEGRKIAAIEPVQRNDAHMLIEECMILANIAAARFLERYKVPGLFRVHEGPKEDKLEDLRRFLGECGLGLPGGEKPEARHFAELLRSVQGRADANVIETVLLRTLNQAVYSPENKGHFGLSLEQYAHFTSPIRRYPDLLVHRAIRHILQGGRPQGADNGVFKRAARAMTGRAPKQVYRYSHADMVKLGEQCSAHERRADEATWDVVGWLKCEYMRDHVGDSFDGVISSVTSFGLFIELDGVYVEGLAHITSLPKDYYHFDPVSHTMSGERSGRSYRLGDRIRVSVARVDLDERKIDFVPEKEDEQPSTGRSKRSRSRNKRK
jgi:ribonuclease R